MKKSLLFFLLFVASISLTFSKTYKIEGKLLNNEQAKYVYLYEVCGNYLQTKVDSALVKKGIFTFLYDDEKFQGIYYIGVVREKSAALMIAQENIFVTAEGTDFSTSLKTQMSPANDAFQQYLQANVQFEKSFANINQEFQQKVMPLEQTNPTLYNSEYQRLVNEIQKTRQVYKDFLIKCSTHENAYIQKVGKLLMINEVTNQLNYFDKKEFFDESLTRGDFIVRKVNLYFTFFTNLTQSTLPQQTELLLQIAPLKSKVRAVVFESLIRAAISNDATFAKRITEVFLEEYPASQYAKDVASLLPQTGEIMIGDKAPEINLPDFNGNNIALSSLRGKIVLIDFWASWCGPCRGENPNVVNLYNEYKDKGFTVYSVSLDGSKDSWVKAIQKDGLAWENHVSELKKWDSSAARMYQVQGIPATFLIDQNGVIIGKNLRGKALEDKLAELFKAK